jgi:hypothetical protein
LTPPPWEKEIFVVAFLDFFLAFVVLSPPPPLIGEGERTKVLGKRIFGNSPSPHRGGGVANGSDSREYLRVEKFQGSRPKGER